MVRVRFLKGVPVFLVLEDAVSKSVGTISQVKSVFLCFPCCVIIFQLEMDEAVAPGILKK